MIFQKYFLMLLLTAAVAILASFGQAYAQQPLYPPMQGMETNVAPAPAYYGGNQRQYYPQNPQQYQPRGAYGPAPYARQPYGRPAPYAGGYGQRPPYSAPYGARPGPRNNGGWNRGPWNGGNQGPGNWFGGNRGPYGNNSPFGNMFGRNGIWGMHPDEWMNSNPEDGFSYMWDDMINAPSEMGEMPGGWNAPSISVPNPVDVGSEFRREAPNLMREIPEMIDVN